MRMLFRSPPTPSGPSPDLRVQHAPALDDDAADSAASDSAAQADGCWVVAHGNGAPYGRTRTWLGRPRPERHYSAKTAAIAAIWRMGPDAIAVARAGRLTTPCPHHPKAARTLLPD
jgi:hypothetical protein